MTVSTTSRGRDGNNLTRENTYGDATTAIRGLEHADRVVWDGLAAVARQNPASGTTRARVLKLLETAAAVQRAVSSAQTQPFAGLT